MKIKSKPDKIATMLFLLPTLIFLGITAFLPLLYSLYISFFRYKLNLPNQPVTFIGLENYIRMFSDNLLHTSTINTIVFALASVSIEMIVGLIIAIMLCSDKLWARLSISIFMIPMIIAPVAAGTVWRMMLDSSIGIVNYLLSFLGVPSITWLSSPDTAMLSVIFVNVWQLTPWVIVICAAGLKSIPIECIHSAVIDGATPFQVLRYMVVPLIKPILIIVLMIRFIDAFKVFDTVYVMTGGGPGSATEMLPNFIYKQGLKFFDVGYAAALAIVFVLTMTLCSLVFLKWRKKEEEASWD